MGRKKLGVAGQPLGVADDLATLRAAKASLDALSERLEAQARGAVARAAKDLAKRLGALLALLGDDPPAPRPPAADPNRK